MPISSQFYGPRAHGNVGRSNHGRRWRREGRDHHCNNTRRSQWHFTSSANATHTISHACVSGRLLVGYFRLGGDAIHLISNNVNKYTSSGRVTAHPLHPVQNLCGGTSQLLASDSKLYVLSVCVVYFVLHETVVIRRHRRQNEAYTQTHTHIDDRHSTYSLQPTTCWVCVCVCV